MCASCLLLALEVAGSFLSETHTFSYRARVAAGKARCSCSGVQHDEYGLGLGHYALQSIRRGGGGDGYTLGWSMAARGGFL